MAEELAWFDHERTAAVYLARAREAAGGPRLVFVRAWHHANARLGRVLMAGTFNLVAPPKAVSRCYVGMIGAGGAATVSFAVALARHLPLFIVGTDQPRTIGPRCSSARGSSRPMVTWAAPSRYGTPGTAAPDGGRD